MRLLLPLVLLGVAAVSVCADPPVEGEAPPPTRFAVADLDPPRITVMQFGKGWSVHEVADDPADAATNQRMAGQVRLPGGVMTLGDVLDCVRDQTGVSISVNWPACEISGIDPETLITPGVTHTSGASMLRIAVKQASVNAFDDEKISWVILDGIVHVSPIYELKTETEVRLYDLGPLVRSRFRPVGLAYEADAREETIAFHAWRRGQREYPLSDTTLREVYEQQIERLEAEIRKLEDPEGVAPEAPPNFDPIARLPENNRGGGLFFADDGPGAAIDPTYQEYVDNLVELIQDTVGDMDEWLDEESTLREVDGMLVVLTTRENHRMVEGLLNMLLANEVQDQAAVLRDIQVMRLLSRASALQLEGDFEGALPLAERALLIDPDHFTARAMHQVLRETMGRVEAGESLDSR